MGELKEATSQDLKEALAYALRFDGRKRAHTADEYMAGITADRLIEHLGKSGFVVMKKPPPAAPSVPPRSSRHLTD